MNIHKLTATIIAGLALVVFGLCIPNCHGQLSVETVGAVRFNGIDKGKQFGAGAVLSYDFNKYVAAFGRAIAYEDNNWGGSAIDEASAGVEAKLFKSANGKLSLSAIGAVHRDLVSEDWGIGLGGKAKAALYGPLYSFGQAEYRVWDHGEKDILLTFGLGLSF
jgi:hypothetical protein